MIVPKENTLVAAGEVWIAVCYLASEDWGYEDCASDGDRILQLWSPEMLEARTWRPGCVEAGFDSPSRASAECSRVIVSCVPGWFLWNAVDGI
jgi:hypothetical protein